MELSQIPNKSFQVIRMSEQEILSLLCDYFLENNPASFNNWRARFIEGNNGLEFVAIFGSTDDSIYGIFEEQFFGNTQSTPNI